MEFGKAEWRDYHEGIRKEWLLANGIGGFASSTLIGANTRRYHGLLIASLKPPVARHLILSKIDENITCGSNSYNLYSCRTPGYVSHGYLRQQRFLQEPLPTFIYTVEDIFFEKKICMVYGENTTVIVYHVINGGRDSLLKLTPLVNYRDYHHNSSRIYMNFIQEESEKGTLIKPKATDINIRISSSEGRFVKKDDCWFLNMYYDAEAERGLTPEDDHFIPGIFEISLEPFEEKYITIFATIENKYKCTDCADGPEIIRAEESRISALLEKAGIRNDIQTEDDKPENDFLFKELVKAADKFIVKRESTDSKTIIAGYPWFTDWGRDTMIALPGLTLATGRFEDAKDILYTFSRYVSGGLIPNMFPDGPYEPAYNTVDAPLWYFEAVYKYIRYTGDYGFIREKIFPALTEIAGSFINETSYSIAMDSDSLITAGNEGTQLTWMDVKIGGYSVTPRHGKAVEVNALWYNALHVMAELSDRFQGNGDYYRKIADSVKRSFYEKFWNKNRQFLYDVVGDGFRDDSIRPNQILAVSLTHPVIEGEAAAIVLKTVWRELYTAYGLRTLSPDDKNYRGVYTGSQYERDSAYHMGTVWAWLLGHFISAYIRVNGINDESKKAVRRFIDPFRDHLRDACIGSISEIFDGNEPLTPRGCFAQAWSVAEILRVYKEYIM